MGATPVNAEAVQQQLAVAGHIARNGPLMDASIIRAPIQLFTKAEKAMLDHGGVSAEWSPAKRAQREREARWTKKHGKSYFGYKVHVSADVRHNLVRKSAVTAAAVHDTKQLEDLLDDSNTSREVSADKGYMDGEREVRLTEANWLVKVQYKAQRGQSLSTCRQGRNRRIAKVRARVNMSLLAYTRWADKRFVRSV